MAMDNIRNDKLDIGSRLLFQTSIRKSHPHTILELFLLACFPCLLAFPPLLTPFPLPTEDAVLALALPLRLLALAAGLLEILLLDDIPKHFSKCKAILLDEIWRPQLFGHGMVYLGSFPGVRP